MTDHEEERQEFARRLFGKPVEPPAPSNPLLGNHVPNEGNNPPATPDHDAEMREFVHDLFDKD